MNFPIPPLTFSTSQTTGCAIKILDLVTNRYHVGIVLAADPAGLIIRMPATSRLRQGQHIRFVLADDVAGIAARRAMRTGKIQHVDVRHGQCEASLELTPEFAAV